MSRIERGENFLSAKEAMELFGAPKNRFHKFIKPRLTPHYFGKWPQYRETEVLALKEGRELRSADISISGIFKNWDEYLNTLGYSSETKDTEIETTTLPHEVIEVFNLSADLQVVKRERMSYADGSPICVWSTYYPADYVNDLLDEMKAGVAGSIVEHIRTKHSLVVEATRERYTARETNFEEMTRLQLRKEEPVIILRRASYTKDRKLVFFSDMVLLAKWFVIDNETKVDHWIA